MNDKNFGKKLKELRKAKGYTQQALAELVGIDEKHLSRLENGKYFPTYSTLNKLLGVLDIKINELDCINISNIEINKNPTLEKILQILNSANENELICYLDTIKALHKALKANRNA